MFNQVYSNLQLIRKQNFGFSKKSQQTNLNRLGFNKNIFLGSALDKFRFIDSKKVDQIFLPRLLKLTRSDLALFGAFFNLNLQKRISRRLGLLKLNRSWRGVRHLFSLPVRGQRTRTNARTIKARRGRKI